MSMSMDPLAAAALMANLHRGVDITYASGHGLVADHNGDPVCACGWDPARELPPELRRTQVDAIRAVNQHKANAEAPGVLRRRPCRDHVLVYLDGKAEYEWACELERGHGGPHTEGRYGWLA